MDEWNITGIIAGIWVAALALCWIGSILSQLLNTYRDHTITERQYNRLLISALEGLDTKMDRHAK